MCWRMYLCTFPPHSFPSTTQCKSQCTCFALEMLPSILYIADNHHLKYQHVSANDSIRFCKQVLSYMSMHCLLNNADERNVAWGRVAGRLTPRDKNKARKGSGSRTSHGYPKHTKNRGVKDFLFTQVRARKSQGEECKQFFWKESKSKSKQIRSKENKPKLSKRKGKAKGIKRKAKGKPKESKSAASKKEACGQEQQQKQKRAKATKKSSRKTGQKHRQQAKADK